VDFSLADHVDAIAHGPTIKVSGYKGVWDLLRYG
jgi:hypothetical protein